MATSFYFNQFNNSPEQLLIEDLVIESIRVFGHDVIYLPRKLIAKDDVYNEDTISQYNNLLSRFYLQWASVNNLDYIQFIWQIPSQ